MANRQFDKVFAQVRHLVGVEDAEATDELLVQRFVGQQDESAFRALLERHGPMVLGICRRTLASRHDAEDAFQATFFVLVRKAASLRDRGLVGNWLYGVACRIARRARQQAARRALSAAEVPEMAIPDPQPPVIGPELRPLLDEELERLPRKYRAPVVLCYLEGRTNEAAARQLRCPTGTVKSRLARARDLLRERLTQRGFVLSGAALIAALAPESATAGVPAPLMETILKSALQSAATGQTAGAVSPAVAGLVEGALRDMLVARLQIIAAVLLALPLIGAGAGLLAYHARGPNEQTTRAAGASSHPNAPVAPLDDDGLAVRVTTRVEEWQPTRQERRFDEVGWAKDLRDARRLARAHNRPIFVVTAGGRIETGRCNASASNMRASAFSHDRVIALLNCYYVPVFLTNKDYAANGTAPEEEKAELLRIRREVVKAGMSDKGWHSWVLNADCRPLPVHPAFTSALAEPLIAMLEFNASELNVPEGKPVAVPRVQSRAPQHTSDELVLHLTARYLERRGDDYVPALVELGRSQNYFCRGCPAENWLVFKREQWVKFLVSGDVKPGTTWTIDPQDAAILFLHCYPPTEDNQVDRNQIEQGTLTATVVTVREDMVRARLDGTLRMKHRFAPEKDDNKFVDATLTGFIDHDLSQPRVRTLQLISTRATYGKSEFGVAVRSVP